jgi:hypothetical protein
MRRLNQAAHFQVLVEVLFFAAGFVFELVGDTFGFVHVIPWTQVNGLEQHPAFLECIQITHFYHLAD